jgi:aldehyde dehydrogenase (NAD+)
MLNNKSYINGEWVNGLGKSFANINPSDTKDIISEYNECDSNQFNQAVEAAKKAQIEWASVGIEKKSNILINIGNELISKSKEIGELLSREEGKTLPEGIGEVARAWSTVSILWCGMLKDGGRKNPIY